MLAAGAYGAPNVVDLTVARIERKAVKEVDETYVQMHLAQAQRLIYGAERPQVTAIVVQLRSTGDTERVLGRVRQILARLPTAEPLAVRDFDALNPQYGQITRMFGAVFGFIALLIATVVLFTVSNTMNMTVMERVVEIGTLRALGLRRRGIVCLFVLEGLLIGLAGTLAGVLLAGLAGTLINHAGLQWVPPGQLDKVAVALNVRLWGEIGLFARVSAGVLIVAVLSAWWPALRASRLPIVNALHHA